LELKGGAVPGTDEGAARRSIDPLRFAAMVAGFAMLGQFAIATYLPAFGDMARDLAASPVQMQQTLTVYILPYGLMMLWHGAISDATGRRRMIIAGNALFALGSLLCAFADGMTMLYAGRMIQGLSAGVGIIVGRAMVRDCFEGPAAQRQMVLIGMVFALAPAVAPVAGGWLLLWFGWRGIFFFLALLGGALLLAAWLWLGETLPGPARQALHPAALIKAYGRAFANRKFVMLSLANTGVTLAIYVYIFGAPTFITQHLGLSAQSYGWLFVPMVAGMIVGGIVAHRLADRFDAWRMIGIGHVVMLSACFCNIVVSAGHQPGALWPLLTLPVFGAGLALTQPGLQLLALDCFPDRIGMASSCFTAIQQLCFALASAFLIPVLVESVLWMALGMAALQVLGALTLWYARGQEKQAAQLATIPAGGWKS
jgi:MFS transporter, DHA1 family, multidrug resistance protein